MEAKQRARQRAIEHTRDWWPAYLVVASAIALRLAILLSTSLVPQTDGAYYLAQVKSLLAGEGLRFSDTPLLFWLQAAVARALTAVTPLTVEAATIAGVKIVDATFPPLVALPVFALWRRWTPRDRRSALAAITVGALAALSFGLVQMTGDLQKNAFALVLVLFAIWAFDTAARRGHARDWALTGLALLGCALSHVGAFAAAITFAVGEGAPPRGRGGRWTGTCRRSRPGSTTSWTTSVRVTIPQASSGSRRSTRRLDIWRPRMHSVAS